MKKKVLIIGASGFTAHFLIKLLSGSSRTELYFLSRQGVSLLNSYICDLENARLVRAMINQINPKEIYHLVGSFTNDYETDYKSNVLISKNIFDALVSDNIRSRVLLIGSAAEYGNVSPEDNPITEHCHLRPVTVYGLTKSYQAYLMDYYYRIHGLDIVMARTFNLLGDGASPLLFIGRIQKQIEKYKKGEVPRIMVGNLDGVRDYIVVEDAVKHYQTIMEHGKAGEVYNVGSGQAVKLFDLLQKLLDEAGLGMGVMDIRKDYKKIGVAAIYADISKLKSLYKTSA